MSLNPLFEPVRPEFHTCKLFTGQAIRGERNMDKYE
jgi:hypothetical protein